MSEYEEGTGMWHGENTNRMPGRRIPARRATVSSPVLTVPMHYDNVVLEIDGEILYVIRNINDEHIAYLGIYSPPWAVNC